MCGTYPIDSSGFAIQISETDITSLYKSECFVVFSYNIVKGNEVNSLILPCFAPRMRKVARQRRNLGSRGAGEQGSREKTTNNQQPATNKITFEA
jgi:hypothetical protein